MTFRAPGGLPTVAVVRKEFGLRPEATHDGWPSISSAGRHSDTPIRRHDSPGTGHQRPLLLLLGFLLGLLLSRRLWRSLCPRLIHKFEVGHQRGIALPRTKLHDSTITPMTTPGPRRHFGKQSLNGVFLPQKRKGYATGMEIAPFTESDHPFGKRPHSLCFRQSRLDSTVLDEAANLVRQQQIPMLGFAAQLNRFLCVTHKSLRERPVSPRRSVRRPSEVQPIPIQISSRDSDPV